MLAPKLSNRSENEKLTRGSPPPKYYYRNNCGTVFRFVLEQYSEMIPPYALEQMQAYLRCSVDAQSLFARVMTRKGPFYRADTLFYDEVKNSAKALEELIGADLMVGRGSYPADLILRLVTKKEISLIWPFFDLNLGKKQLVAQLLGCYTDPQISGKIEKLVSVVKVRKPQVWRLVKLLYFGNEQQNWSDFVVRDLGLIEVDPPISITKQFQNKIELEAHLRFLELASYTYRLEEFFGLPEFLISRMSIRFNNRSTERRRVKGILRLAKWLEQEGMMLQALEAFAASDKHPSRERMVRIHHKMENFYSRDCLLDQIREFPSCEEEEQFAQRFGRRNAGYLPKSSVLYVERTGDNIELTALRSLTSSGGWGVHSENSFLRSLTGLVYWDVVHAPIAGAFTNPLQGWPNDLNEPDFSIVRSAEIERVEGLIGTDEKLLDHIQRIFTSKLGLSSGLVSWSLFKDHSLEAFVEAIGCADLRRLMAYFIRHIYSRRKGFPDLFLVHADGSYEFVEIKGPGDQLSLHQRVWLQKLEELSIPCRVLKVKLNDE